MEKLTNIIESILLVSGNAVSVADISEKLEVTPAEINKCVERLKVKYGEDSGIQLLSFNKKLQFASNPDYASAVASVLNPIREKELSKSLLEVSAIIAYKQPITRTEIEEIRGGVSCDYAMMKLLELKIIEPVGRKDAVGKPILYGTTDEFLKRFQISGLDDLPDYNELMERLAKLKTVTTVDLYNSNRDVVPEGAEGENVDDDGLKTTNVAEAVENVDADLPDIGEEEIPDFLQGEDVVKL